MNAFVTVESAADVRLTSGVEKRRHHILITSAASIKLALCKRSNQPLIDRRATKVAGYESKQTRACVGHLSIKVMSCYRKDPRCVTPQRPSYAVTNDCRKRVPGERLFV